MKNVVLQIVLTIILQESELFHVIVYLMMMMMVMIMMMMMMKTLTFDNVLIHIMSIINKNKNKYYCNIFLEKSLYKYKSNAQYF